jgi:hypothetical protein
MKRDAEMLQALADQVDRMAAIIDKSSRWDKPE